MAPNRQERIPWSIRRLLIRRLLIRRLLICK